MTVAQLRELLETLPGEMSVHVWVAGDEVGDELRTVHDERTNNVNCVVLSSGHE